MSQALCLGVTHLLFPVKEDGTDDTSASAPRICFQCPVSLSCLQDGWDEKFGIWGGFNLEERIEAKVNRQSPEDLWNTKHSTVT